VASPLDRAARYVEKMPAAESGNHGHDATFAVAVTLVHGFALPEATAWPILCEFNKRCLPPWSERELRHKLEDANKLTRHSKPRGHLLGAVSERASFPSVRFSTGESIPWEADMSEPLLCQRGEPMAKMPAGHEDAVAQREGELNAGELTQASRIACELIRLHRDGAIKEPADASFYANLVHLFDANYTKRVVAESDANSPDQREPTIDSNGSNQTL
jgi:hypothetical protein